MSKSYQDASDKERYDSAEKMKKEKYSPMDALRKLVSPKQEPVPPTPPAGLPEGKKKGGTIKMAKGGSASSRADGCCIKGKTRGRMV